MLKRMQSILTDGLLFYPLALDQEDAWMLEVDYPLVLMGEKVFSDAVDHVTMKNTEAARMATEHLLSLGRRRIVALGARCLAIPRLR